MRILFSYIIHLFSVLIFISLLYLREKDYYSTKRKTIYSEYEDSLETLQDSDEDVVLENISVVGKFRNKIPSVLDRAYSYFFSKNREIYSSTMFSIEFGVNRGIVHVGNKIGYKQNLLDIFNKLVKMVL